jgi:hypothetical protein
MANKARLDGGRELTFLSQKDPYLGSLLQRMIDSVNHLAKNSAVGAVGKLSPPDPVNDINVQGDFDSGTNTLTVPSEILHFTLTHNAPVQKGVRYFSEISTDPDFRQPHVIDHGTSRTGFVHLPELDGDGNAHTYYMRSYPQYAGSDPQKPTVYGGLHAATKIVMNGGAGTGSKMNLLGSTGSGTASPNGQQGGKGLGVVLNRPAPGPKRNLQ